MAQHYLVLDLEMTGPEPGWNEMIQIGAVLCDEDWNEVGHFLTNVYPENEESFSSYAEKIHNLSLADLEDAPMLYDALENFEKAIMKAGYFKNRGELKKLIICGQSVINDINFLTQAYRDEKMNWPYSYTMLDLHDLSYFLFKILNKNGVETPRSRSLTAVAGYFGFERESEIHNALEDSRLTAACFQKVFEFTEKLKLK